MLLKTYDETLGVLRRALDAAKVGQTEKLEGFRRLDRLTRSIEERRAPEAEFDAVLKHEREISPTLGGRTVFGEAKPQRRKSRQMDLFS